MGLKYIFLALCVCIACIILLIVLKENFPERLQERSTHLRHFDIAEKKIFYNTEYLVEPKCNSSFVVWIVTSSAESPSSRTALRRAYPNEELTMLNVKRIFLLGIPADEAIQKIVSKESEKYGDVLQGNFMEAYRNLTLKHLMGLKWTSRNCVARFLIKTDDDIVLDLFHVLKLLEEGTIKRNMIYGYGLKKMLPIRTPGNKWFVTKEEFSGNVYPDFLSGWFYVTSMRTIQKLIDVNEISDKLFWIDDVYVTGILRDKCGITIGELNSFYTTDYRYLECCIQGMAKRLKCDFIAGPDGGQKELHIEFKEFSSFCHWNCLDRLRKQSVAKTCVAAYKENIRPENSRVQIYSVQNL